MVRIQLQLDAPTYDVLRRIAHQRHESMSAVIREILHEHLSMRTTPGEAPFSFIATGASGYHDTSVKHDETLAAVDR